jgi:hypothetical protein
VETTDIEAPKPHLLPKAINIEWHTSHLLVQEPSPVSSVDPDDPKPSLMPMDHLVTFSINQALASTVVYAMTYNMPYYEAVSIPFRATPGPAHSESTKQIPLTLSDTPNPPSMYAEANSPAEGSANTNSSTAKNWHATSEHMSFIDGGTLPQLSQQQRTALSSTTKCDHVTVVHSNTEVPWPHSITSLIPRDLMPPSTFISNSLAPTMPPHSHQHHLQTKHIDMHHHQTIETGPIHPTPCLIDDVLTDTLTKPLPLAKVEHFATLLRLHAK